jgi:DnaA family protein
MIQQFPLQFELAVEQSFSSFYTANNQEAIAALTKTTNGTGEQQLFIWGPTGTGKTHLLQACCQLAHHQQQRAFFLPLAAERLPKPEILDGLDAFDLVCIDDIATCAGNAEWELALFNFYNRHRDNDHRLILSAGCPPNLLPINLPDLKTRMSWGLTLKLQELTDTDCIAAFTCKAKYLGFEISPQVGKFLSKHYARDLATLWDLLPQLEQATLIAKRKLTVPFLKEVLSKQEKR